MTQYKKTVAVVLLCACLSGGVANQGSLVPVVYADDAEMCAPNPVALLIWGVYWAVMVARALTTNPAIQATLLTATQRLSQMATRVETSGIYCGLHTELSQLLDEMNGIAAGAAGQFATQMNNVTTQITSLMNLIGNPNCPCEEDEGEEGDQ